MLNLKQPVSHWINGWQQAISWLTLNDAENKCAFSWWTQKSKVRLTFSSLTATRMQLQNSPRRCSRVSVCFDPTLAFKRILIFSQITTAVLSALCGRGRAATWTKPQTKINKTWPVVPLCCFIDLSDDCVLYSQRECRSCTFHRLPCWLLAHWMGWCEVFIKANSGSPVFPRAQQLCAYLECKNREFTIMCAQPP